MTIQEVKTKFNNLEHDGKKLKTVILIKRTLGLNLWDAKSLTDKFFNRNRKRNKKQLGTEIIEYCKNDEKRNGL